MSFSGSRNSDGTPTSRNRRRSPNIDLDEATLQQIAAAIAGGDPNFDLADYIPAYSGTNFEEEQAPEPEPPINAPPPPAQAASRSSGASSSAGTRKTFSDVWAEYNTEYVTTEDGQVQLWAIHKLCNKRFRGESTKGTTGLRKHHISCKAALDRALGLRTIHEENTRQEAEVQVSALTPESSREELARFILGAELPLNFSENRYFRRFMKVHAPGFRHISRGTMRRIIITYWQKKKEAIQLELGLGSFNVALTSDVWSGRAKQDYVSVVAHYIDKDWIMQKRIIGFRLLDDRHTGVNIAERVLNVITE